MDGPRRAALYSGCRESEDILDQRVTTVIDSARCNGCGSCVKVCPSDTLRLVDGKAAVVGDRSLNCGHCQAACPQEAVRVNALDEGRLHSFQVSEDWVPHGRPDAASLVALMRSRRSCRSFKDRPVSLEVLRDLALVGTSAPSGTNCQAWTFNILPDRNAVLAVARETLAFFERLNWMAEQRWLRLGMRLLGKRELDAYRANYYERVKEAVTEFKRGGRERLFHGATAAILIGSRPGATTPVEDALLATQNILLCAHALGLGTCLVGFVVAASHRRPAIKVRAGMPADEPLHAVIALGYPAESYQRQARRLLPTVRIARG